MAAAERCKVIPWGVYINKHKVYYTHRRVHRTTCRSAARRKSLNPFYRARRRVFLRFYDPSLSAIYTYLYMSECIYVYIKRVVHVGFPRGSRSLFLGLPSHLHFRKGEDNRLERLSPAARYATRLLCLMLLYIIQSPQVYQSHLSVVYICNII